MRYVGAAEEHVLMRGGRSRDFLDVSLKLLVVGRGDSRKDFGGNASLIATLNVRSRLCSKIQGQGSNTRVLVENERRPLERGKIREGLIQLLNDVERVR